MKSNKPYRDVISNGTITEAQFHLIALVDAWMRGTIQDTWQYHGTKLPTVGPSGPVVYGGSLSLNLHGVLDRPCGDLDLVVTKEVDLYRLKSVLHDLGSYKRSPMDRPGWWVQGATMVLDPYGNYKYNDGGQNHFRFNVRMVEVRSPLDGASVLKSVHSLKVCIFLNSSVTYNEFDIGGRFGKTFAKFGSDLDGLYARSPVWPTSGGTYTVIAQTPHEIMPYKHQYAISRKAPVSTKHRRDLEAYREYRIRQHADKLDQLEKAVGIGDGDIVGASIEEYDAIVWYRELLDGWRSVLRSGKLLTVEQLKNINELYASVRAGNHRRLM